MTNTSLFFVILMFNFCMLTLQNLTQNKRLNCSAKHAQDCTVTHNTLNCTNFSLSHPHFNSDGNLEFQNENVQCLLYRRRRKTKIYHCLILHNSDLQKHIFTNCNCKCILKPKISGITRRDLEEKGAVKQCNFTVNIIPIPETGVVDVDFKVNIAPNISAKMLIYGLNKKDCKGGDRIFDTFYRLTSVNKTVRFNFNNASKPGNYCLMILMDCGHRDYCRNFEMQSSENYSITLPSQSSDSGFEEKFIFYIFFALLSIATISGFIIFIRFRRKSSISAQKPTQVVTIALSRPKVLIMYGSFDEEHLKTVKLFAKLLEESFNCLIISDWLEPEKYEIAKNMYLWVMEQVEKCEKIIVVNCQQMFEREQQFMKNTTYKSPDSDQYMFMIFNDFLTIVSNQKYRYKICNIRFFGTSDNWTLKCVRGDCLEIPYQLRELFIWLHNVNPKDASDTLDLQWLTSDTYKEFCGNLNIPITSKEESIVKIEPHSPNSTTTLISRDNSSSSLPVL